MENSYIQLDYQLYDLPTLSKEDEEAHVLLNTGLLARIEALKSKNRELKAKLLHATNASSSFTADDEGVMPLHSYRQGKAVTFWLSGGSSKLTPGISVSVRSTETKLLEESSTVS